MTEQTPILSVRELHCGYTDIPVLHGISFDVFPKEKLCILGANGCGKTTLLRAIARILPFHGSVTACGLSIHQAKRIEIARIMAFLSQMNTICFSYSVYQTVMMGRYCHKKGMFSSDVPAGQGVVEESMRQTGIWELRDRPICELSGGQLQRVLLARVFAQSPSIILLDEPTNHLDLKYQVELIAYLNEWVKSGERCVVSVMHDINLALSFADKLLLLKDGVAIDTAPANACSLKSLDKAYEMDIDSYMSAASERWKHLTAYNKEREKNEQTL
ncbi:MAG: ABC transporter ATP-binding protein [Roseburia sp.]